MWAFFDTITLACLVGLNRQMHRHPAHNAAIADQHGSFDDRGEARERREKRCEGAKMKYRLSLLLFLVLVLGGGLAIGFLTAPSGWYAGLSKPPFNPPPWVFAPVWVVLYTLIALAGWRSFERDTAGWPMRLW
jgi:TspO/MBR family